MSELIGAVISHKYRLTHFLGQGGLGRVFLAEQWPLGRQVAIKVLHPEFSNEPDLAARFEREALAASRISHPNTVVIHDFGSETVGSQKQLYLVMEYLSGETLHDRIQDHPRRRLPVWEAVHILSQVLRPLGAFHRAGVIHRDLKPDNIMLCKSEIGEQVKLLDFGIAKVTGASLTATGQMVGTPHYMAPEQIMAKKDLGPAVDIYAMGILLYEALTGDPPFMAEHQIDLLRMHLVEPPALLAKRFPGEFLEGFDEVIQKAMAKKPAERYQSAEELRMAMEKALVTSVAKEQESLEVTQARKRLTPSWWYRTESVEGITQKSTTEAKPVQHAKTSSREPSLVEETIKMERLVLPEKEWLLTDLETVREIPPLTRVHQRVGFWKRVSKLWQLFKK
jgi:eukaryotic-like serine/threonine-protein kinase